MKRIVVLILFLLGLWLPGFAGEPTNLTFLYINGSNNNDEKMKTWYLKGVNNLHPEMKKRLEKNSYIKKWTKNNKLVIDSEPKIFFWGYNSKTDLEYVKERLDISKAFSSTIAYEVRSMLTQFLHDAVWVQKEHNMLPILDELNNELISLSRKNQKVVLFGYSAGTFVTFQYMVYKLPYINFEQLFQTLESDEELLQFVRENPRENTCLSAILHDKGNIGVLSNTGHLVLNQDREQLKLNYLNINDVTKMYCMPENEVVAVVNFASPLPLFYSDLADQDYELSFYNKYMLKYIMENGIYFLTVNFREDPLGFPSSHNLTIPQLEERLDIKLDSPSGMLYDNSKVWSKRMSFVAHTSYWSAKKVFSKAVAKSFVDGKRYLYDEKYQRKMQKRKLRKDPEIITQQ